MSQHQQRQSKMVNKFALGDTTYTKIFVGGLAWETQRDTMESYFEQFGEIHEAVIITDRSSGKSKGYGFVTFKDPESAKRACQDPYPVIDGRRANCNLAYLGAQKNHPQIHVTGMEKTRQPAAISSVHGTSKYICQPAPQYPVTYSTLGYPTYSQYIDAMNAYGGQYYTNWASRFPAGVYINYYPFYAPNEHTHSHTQSSSPTQFHTQSSSPTQFHSQYHKMAQFPYMPSGILSASPSVTVSAGAATATVKPPGTTASRQNSSA